MEDAMKTTSYAHSLFLFFWNLVGKIAKYLTSARAKHAEGAHQTRPLPRKNADTASR
jgi:hypothetical protein